MPRRMMVFIDGENITMRYQAMVEKGFKPSPKVVHVKDTFVWHPDALQIMYFDILRVSYYTYAVGTDEYLKQVCDQLKKFSYISRMSRSDFSDTNYIYPRVFKKNKQSAKRKGVDISITVEALTHTFNNSIDIAYLMTGDGDYIPLINEIIRNGKKVFLAAFSEGLNPALPNSVDIFNTLDKVFFENSPP
jgi:uncharacterized LabA/DUF88 family protein